MIGLDTNILLRALTRDDPVRSPIAERILSDLTAERPGYINLVVLAELVWNLRRKYKAQFKDIVETVENILQSPAFVVSDRDAVIEGLEIARAEGLDFADALIAALNRRAACEATVTFEGKAAESRWFTSAMP